MVKEPEPEPEPRIARRPQRDDDDEYDDEDDEYEADEEDDEKAHLERKYLADETAKDPRGPAQMSLVKPSNNLMITGFLLILMQAVDLFILVFPFVFSDHMGLEPKDFIKSTAPAAPAGGGGKDAKPVQKEWKDLSDAEREQAKEAEAEKRTRNLLMMIPAFFGIAYGVAIVYGAVTMQNMESYRWSMACVILVLFPAAYAGFGVSGLWWFHEYLDGPDEYTGLMPVVLWGLWCLLIGVSALKVLRSKLVLDGFNFKPD